MSEEATTTEEVPESTTTETTEATTTTDMAFVDSMLEQITDEDVKGHKMWDNLKGKDANELGKYVRELKSFTGKKGDIPKEDAPKEEWDSFYQKLGRPESAEGYDWSIGDEFKEKVGASQAEFFEQATEWFKGAAFEGGMDNKKAEQLFNGYLEMVANQYDAIGEATAARAAESATALKNEWGDSSEGIELGIKAMLKDKGGMSVDEIGELEAGGLLKDPKIAIALGRISAKFQDDSEIGDLHTGTKAGLEDQRHELETQMLEEREKYGAIRPETTEKWQRTLDKINMA